MADIHKFPHKPIRREDPPLATFDDDPEISRRVLEFEEQPDDQMEYYKVDTKTGTITFDKDSKYYQFEKAGLAAHGYDLDTISDFFTYLDLTNRYRNTIQQFFIDDIMIRHNSMFNRAMKAIVTGDSEKGLAILKKLDRIRELGLKTVPQADEEKDPSR